MKESMILFESISKNKWFANTPIMLFLNKIDLFEEKIKTSPLNICFPEYNGDNSFSSTTCYIQQQFLFLKSEQNSKVYVHLTNATDTENIKLVFSIATDIVLNKNLVNLGLA